MPARIYPKSLQFALFALTGALTALLGILPGIAAESGEKAITQNASKNCLKAPEGPLVAGEMIVGPFDLHRKYRSMEGPFVNQAISIGDLLEAKAVSIPESRVFFVEDNTQMPSMKAAIAANSKKLTDSPLPDRFKLPSNRVCKERKRQLYWLKGIKLEVIDENNNVMPSAEFICHFNLDIRVERRNELFPAGERTNNPRLISLTQGQTELHFPVGYGVPVASDEVWTLGFQAANRTSDVLRRIKHRCILYFIADSELKQPMTALNWYVPYCTVALKDSDKNTVGAATVHGPSCLPDATGEVAPNQGAMLSVFSDLSGRNLSGHWTVPVGEHRYSSAIVNERDPQFADKDRRIHAVWTHVHPLCTSTSLVECDGQTRRSLYTAFAKTKTDGGLEIKHIDTISSRRGILLRKGRHYELTGYYNNRTGSAQDSMISHGIFYSDNTFARPDWVKFTVQEGDGESTSAVGAAGFGERRLFDPLLDGPLISGDKYLQLATTAGNLKLVIEPALAPQNATQMYRLFTKGAFRGTPVFYYMPGFLLQIASVEIKHDRQNLLSPDLRWQLRWLPLEVKAQESGQVSHQRLALSMARADGKDTAESSFCIMLNSSWEMDSKYTIFGHLLSDEATLATLEKIGREWQQTRPYLLSTTEIEAPPGVASDKTKKMFSSVDGANEKKSVSAPFCGVPIRNPGQPR